MTHSTRIASLHLLESGNVEIDTPPTDNVGVALARLCAVVILWDNPEFQALLDKAIAADIGGTE